MRLKELRDERALTQTDVARGVNTNQQNISRWEKGEVLPTSDFIIKLADFFFGFCRSAGRVLVCGGVSRRTCYKTSVRESAKAQKPPQTSSVLREKKEVERCRNPNI